MATSTLAAVVETVLAAGVVLAPVAVFWLWACPANALTRLAGRASRGRVRYEAPPVPVPADPAPAASVGTGAPSADSMNAVEFALFAHAHGLCGWCPDPERDPQFCPAVLEAVDEDATQNARRLPPPT